LVDGKLPDVLLSSFNQEKEEKAGKIENNNNKMNLIRQSF